MKKLITILLIAILAMIALTACGSGNDEPPVVESPVVEQTPEPTPEIVEQTPESTLEPEIEIEPEIEVEDEVEMESGVATSRISLPSLEGEIVKVETMSV